MTGQTADPAGRPGRQGGFSFIEVIIAAGILLIIALGTLPLFTQSMRSNLAGNDSTKVANFARGRVEEFFQLPFGHPFFTITSGTENTFDEEYSRDEERWVAAGTLNPGDVPLWTRRTIVRQYGVDALDDNVVTAAEALAAGADPSAVHFREIEVTVQSTRQTGALAVRPIALRVFKSP